jgi:hypothetical protein
MVGSSWLQIQIGNKRRQPQRRERGREGDHAQVSSLLPVGPSHLFWEPVVNIKISQRIKKRERNKEHYSKICMSRTELIKTMDKNTMFLVFSTNIYPVWCL